MKPELWGSPLVQEKYREEKACDKRHPYRIIIIIIITNAVFFAETEGFLTAIQDQVILTRNYKIYFEASRHRRPMQKMWKRIGDNPTHYYSM